MSDFPQKTWPDDMHERWRASVFTDSCGVRSLHISCRRPGGAMAARLAVLPMSFKESAIMEMTDAVLSETFEEERDGLGDVTNFLKAIVEAAWEAGIRPDSMKDRQGEIGAVRYHLEDMRRLVFDQTERPVDPDASIRK